MKTLFTAFVMLLISGTAFAAGSQYQPTAQAIPTDDPAKIEVIEMFWYGCPHCHDLEPYINVWMKKLPKDVVFKRVPAVPRPDWVPGGRAYYTMEALGVLEKLHTPFFEAIHKQRAVNPSDDKAVMDWITKNSGLDRQKVADAYNSFSVNTKLQRAMQIFSASGATGVPTLIVDGKYITSISMSGGLEQTLQVADQLIAKTRAEKTGKK
ncbi:MAG: thiol:disulfide interchange protein DsbA/DsbL [Methylobacillus sp.]|jgi:thiol:disulfide interchange protein DsbA|nr:thiol:disulfide interchange protein DsbA/DsbL [Methylobacillus sp.]